MYLCKQCGKTLATRRNFCEECRVERRKARMMVKVLPCKVCGQMVTLSGQRGLEQAKDNAVYCSKEHKQKWMRQRRSELMSQTNRRFTHQIVERMVNRNPMRSEETRQQVSRTLQEIGHQPKARGGNGRPAPLPARMLSEALRLPLEVPIRTYQRRGSGYPTCYKADLACTELKIAVEVDGPSHCSRIRQAQDRKKQAFLELLGWTVLRFTNREVMEHLEDCVRTVQSTISKLRATTTTSSMAS